MLTPKPLRARLLAAVCLTMLSAPACVHHRHSVGMGATGTGAELARQYYVLFGLLQTNTVSAQRMADGLTSYTIETSYSLMDLVLQPLLLPLTMTSRTVQVRT